MPASSRAVSDDRVTEAHQGICGPAKRPCSKWFGARDEFSHPCARETASVGAAQYPPADALLKTGDRAAAHQRGTNTQAAKMVIADGINPASKPSSGVA